MEKVSVVIAGAGEGKRFGGNKLFVNLNGIPLIVHTLKIFEETEEIDEIILVLSVDNFSFFKRLQKEYKLRKIKKIVRGGKFRQDSVFEGLKKVNKKNKFVLIHDGARPLIDKSLTKKIIIKLKKYNAVIPGVLVKDTIKIIKNNEVKMTLPREYLFSIQTPQGFRTNLILEAHKLAKKEKIYSTDDSALLERMGHKVKFIFGSYENIKVTTKEDLILVEEILKRKCKSV